MVTSGFTQGLRRTQTLFLDFSPASVTVVWKHLVWFLFFITSNKISFLFRKRNFKFLCDGRPGPIHNLFTASVSQLLACTRGALSLNQYIVLTLCVRVVDVKSMDNSEVQVLGGFLSRRE